MEVVVDVLLELVEDEAVVEEGPTVVVVAGSVVDEVEVGGTVVDGDTSTVQTNPSLSKSQSYTPSVITDDDAGSG